MGFSEYVNSYSPKIKPKMIENLEKIECQYLEVVCLICNSWNRWKKTDLRIFYLAKSEVCFHGIKIMEISIKTVRRGTFLLLIFFFGNEIQMNRMGQELSACQRQIKK